MTRRSKFPSQLTMPPEPQSEGVQFAHISGFDGYLVSDDGRVMTCKVQNSGVTRYYSFWRELKAHAHQKNRYITVGLHDRHSPHKTYLRRVHRLMLETFVGPCPAGMESSHINGNRSDNRLANLCWESHSDNLDRKRQHGTSLNGERKPNAKLNPIQVQEIMLARKRGQTIDSLAIQYSVARVTIYKIVYRKSWTHITPL